nr:T9SS type A sorting domain-containing protein [Bacteroidota bacterium]
VDKDGNFKYSKTVNVKINTARTGVSVLANPFHNSLQVDFLSSKDEVVNARLVDITGKQVANEKWSITAGNTRKEFSNISALQQGMYILSVYNGAGEVLYNNKVIKQ